MEMPNPKDYEVYDAKDKILGRLASTVAKRLLLDKKVIIVNSENAIISGSAKTIAAKYKTRLNLLELANPEKSPYWSRRPDMLVKRIVRGMLPYNMPRGKAAYRNLRVFNGTPEELKSAKQIEIESKDPKKIYTGYITIKELSTMLGYDKR
jgi:large subunit ribosomal protein L13